MLRPRRALVALLLAAAPLAACSGTPGPDGPAAADTATSTPAPVPDTSTTGAGCTAEGPLPAEGAVTRDVGDVDGDGRDDRAWLAPASSGAVTVGIRTAAGGSSAVAISSPAPAGRSLLVADADGDARSELFFSDGRTVDLYAFDACAVTPVLDEEGRTYEFDLGPAGTGTGVGCLALDGVRSLVGLHRTSSTATQVGWTRTVVRIEGLIARDGQTRTGTYSLPADEGAAALLSQVTCGDRTTTDDGLLLDA